MTFHSIFLTACSEGGRILITTAGVTVIFFVFLIGSYKFSKWAFSRMIAPRVDDFIKGTYEDRKSYRMDVKEMFDRQVEIAVQVSSDRIKVHKSLDAINNNLTNIDRNLTGLNAGQKEILAFMKRINGVST